MAQRSKAGIEVGDGRESSTGCLHTGWPVSLWLYQVPLKPRGSARGQ